MKFMPSVPMHCQIGPFLAPMGDSDPHIQLNNREIATLEKALKVLNDLSCLCKDHSLDELAIESGGAEARLDDIIWYALACRSTSNRQPKP